MAVFILLLAVALAQMVWAKKLRRSGNIEASLIASYGAILSSVGAVVVLATQVA